MVKNTLQLLVFRSIYWAIFFLYRKYRLKINSWYNKDLNVVNW